MERLKWLKPEDLVSVRMTITCPLHKGGSAQRITVRTCDRDETEQCLNLRGRGTESEFVTATQNSPCPISVELSLHRNLHDWCITHNIPRSLGKKEEASWSCFHLRRFTFSQNWWEVTIKTKTLQIFTNVISNDLPENGSREEVA